MLAGVSVTWYTWLEQGRRINASATCSRRSPGRCGSTTPGSITCSSLAEPATATVGAPTEPPSAAACAC